jgi:hypothetical protein
VVMVVEKALPVVGRAEQVCWGGGHRGGGASRPALIKLIKDLGGGLFFLRCGI